MLPSLAEPIAYTLASGGKRIRPRLVLAAYGAYASDTEVVFALARAIEYFHNFSLIHDDIMDDAPLRRGRPSAYGKYGADRAILSGDAMLVYCYRILEEYQDRACYGQLISGFSQMAIGVCEGQQMDMEFEEREIIQRHEYITMISKKTADLLSAALVLGARLASAPEDQLLHWHRMGQLLGVAFQMEDDWLDYYSDHPALGKQKAGDVIQKKKSILYITACEKLDSAERSRFVELYHADLDTKLRLSQVEEIFENLSIREAVRADIEGYKAEITETMKVLSQFANIVALQELADYLAGRKY